MAKKLYIINTEARRACIYAVEAETRDDAMRLLNAAGLKAKPIMRATTSQDIIAAGEGTVEDLKNALDIANMIPNSDLLVQENVHEDDIEKTIVRESEGAGLAAPANGVDPFQRLIADLKNFQPNPGDKLH